jgi:hypothetical protein
MVFSLVVPSTTLETCDVALHGPHPGERGPAFATGVEVPAFKTDALQRKIMAPRFVRDAQILARLTPFGPMRRDLPATDAMLREEVGKLMTQGALDFRGRDLNELRVERNRLGSPACETGRRSEPGIPFHGHLKSRTTRRAQELATKSFEEHVPLVLTRFARLRVGIRNLGEKTQVTQNRFSKVEHDESLFHQAAMG